MPFVLILSSIKLFSLRLSDILHFRGSIQISTRAVCFQVYFACGSVKLAQE